MNLLPTDWLRWAENVPGTSTYSIDGNVLTVASVDSSNPSILYYDIPVKEGYVINFSVMARKVSNYVKIYLDTFLDTTKILSLTRVIDKDDWKIYEINYVIPSGVNIVRLSLGLATADIGSIQFQTPKLTIEDYEDNLHYEYTPTLLNSWVNYGSGYANIKFHRRGGKIKIEGKVKSGTTGVICNIPVALHPKNGYQEYPIVTDSGPATLRVSTTLEIISAGYGTGYVSLSSVEYIGK
jgi:ribosomal protein S8